MVGLFAGMIRMILDFAYPTPLCGEIDSRSEGMKKLLSMHYLYFGIMLFGLALIVVVVVSLMTDPIDPKHVSNAFFVMHQTHLKFKQVFLCMDLLYGARGSTVNTKANVAELVA